MKDWRIRRQMDHKQREKRCKGRTRAGKPCPAAATPGGLCYFHANPNKAAELGQIGGRSKRPVGTENADPLPTLDNAMAVRDAVNRLIADVHSGKIPLKTAAGLAPLLHLQLDAIKITDIDLRLFKLERERKSDESGGGLENAKPENAAKGGAEQA
jgi:hypothetical protein